MISLRWNRIEGEIGALIARYAELPRHIAKKHMKAAMKRTLKTGVKILKQMTPKSGTRTVRAAITRDARGRIQAGSGKISKKRGGALRRAATTKAKYIGRNRDGLVWGVVGYRGGAESRKAIWLEYGTKRLKPREIMEAFRRKYGGPTAYRIAAELRRALPRAVREVAAGFNANSNYRGKRA